MCTTFREIKLQTAFRGPPVGQEGSVMESPEENALNEVDRISVAVDYLRDLLIAATEAELRAKERQRSSEGPPG
jgi:hypothetical protein